MQLNEQPALMTKIIPVDTRISPSPTKGETIPPEAKQTAPNSAEAVPALSRWHSIANVVVDVKVSPIINNKTSRSASYIQKLHPVISAVHSPSAATAMPTQPINVLLTGRLNFTDVAAATPIATALTAKQKLNTNGEYP